MIIQNIYIDKYDWIIIVYYYKDAYYLNRISKHLDFLECTGKEYADIYDLITSGKHNIGLTFSNFDLGESLIVIGQTDNAAEFQDTLDHEKGHLVNHIATAKGIDINSEEYQYLAGEIGRRMFPVAKRFLCDECRQKLEK